MDPKKAAAEIDRIVQPSSTGLCAKHVRLGLMAGDVPLQNWPENAREYKTYLPKYGFETVSSANTFDHPEQGDVCVLEPYPGGHPAGHICMWDGKQWVSDFGQRDFWGGPGWRDNLTSHVFMRHPSCKGHSASAPSTYNPAVAASEINALVQHPATTLCAKHVRLAITKAGVPLTNWPGTAREYREYLPRNDFAQVPAGDYFPIKGDVVVFQPYAGGEPDGHIALYDGERWVSDTVQATFYGEPARREADPEHAFFRHRSVK